MNVLCVDIGTSSLKTAVIGENGDVLAFKRRFLLLYTTDNAAREWYSTLQNVINDLFENHPDIHVDAVCISGNGPTLVADSGRTLLWNEKVQEIKSKSMFVPRIAAFKDMLGNEWNDVKTVFSGPEYLIYRLTDSFVTILPHDDFIDAYWTKEEFLSCGLSEDDFDKMPPFKKPGDMAGMLTHKAVSFLSHESNGLVEGVPVYCGAPDFISAIVGTNTLHPGALCDRAGSSEGLNYCSDRKIEAAGIRCLPNPSSGLWNASIILPDTGLKFSAFKKKLEREDGCEYRFHDLIDAILMSDGSNPSYDQGKYLMIQTALDVRNALKVLKGLAKENGQVIPLKMIVTGGQALHDGWNQMKADITGITVCVTSCPDAELLGDAIFVFAGCGLYESVEKAAEKLVKIEKTFIPRES